MNRLFLLLSLVLLVGVGFVSASFEFSNDSFVVSQTTTFQSNPSLVADANYWRVASRDSNRNERGYVTLNISDVGGLVGDSALNISGVWSLNTISSIDVDFYYCPNDVVVGSVVNWNNQDSQITNCELNPFHSLALDYPSFPSRVIVPLPSELVDVFTIKIVSNPESFDSTNRRNGFNGGSEVIFMWNENNFTVTAEDVYSSASVNTFNLTMTPPFGVSTDYNTTDGSIVTDIPRNSTELWLVEWSAPNYFSQTFQNYNVSNNLAVNATPWTEIFAETIADGTPINDFTVTLEGVDYSTTSGSAFIPLFDGTFNVTLNASGYAIRTEELTANPYLQNYTFELYTMNSFDIEFRNETTNEVLDNVNITVEFISDAFAFNTSTSNGTLFVDLLTPGSYQIRYYYDPAVPRSYFTTLTPQSFQELILYAIEEDISAFYVPRAVDGGGSACQDQTISLLRYYIEGNQYRTVEMSRTDSQGQAVLRVQPNIVDYKLLFSGGCGTYTTPPTRFIDTTNTYSILDAQSPLLGTQAILGASTSLTYINATETFVYTWTSDSNLISHGCLRVIKRAAGVRTTEFDACVEGNTGSIPYTLTDTNETTYFAQGRLQTNTEFSTYTTNEQEISFLTGLFQLNNIAPFIALILFLAVVLFFGVSGPTLVIGTVFGLIIISTFLFLPIPWPFLSTIIILGGVILYRLRTL